MARPVKKGLDYFPQNTDMYNDRNIKKLINDFSPKGFLVYDYIKAQCFRGNGYWVQFDEILCEDIIDVLKSGVTKELIAEVISACIRMGLFSEKVFNRCGILTSADIQSTYLEAKRTPVIADEIWVIDATTRVNAAKTPVNAAISTQRKEKEIKTNESKEKESNFFNGDVKENYPDIEQLRNAIISDERYLSLIEAAGVSKMLIPGWLAAFNRMLQFKNIRSKDEPDYRSHFANWLVKIPGFTRMHPDSYSPLKGFAKEKPYFSASDEKIRKMMGK